MKTATRKLKISPTATYVAWQGLSMTDVDGAPLGCPRGTRLLGSNPLVRKFGAEGFVPADLPESEWPSPYSASIEMLAAEDANRRADEAAVAVAKPRLDPSMPISELWICTNTIIASRAGGCPKGGVVFAGDPRIAAAPEWFRPLIDTLTLG